MIVLTRGFVVYFFIWVVSSKIIFLWNRLYINLMKLNLSSILFAVLIIIICGLNLLSLVFSNMFRMIYGMAGLLGFGLWLWGLMILLGHVSLSSYVSHFCTDNTPLMLRIVLPTLELFSVIIRPLTLRIRLATNITRGHVLLVMFFLFIRSLKGSLLILILPMLWVLETCVAVLQAFIFSTLVEMYQR